MIFNMIMSYFKNLAAVELETGYKIDAFKSAKIMLIMIVLLNLNFTKLN